MRIEHTPDGPLAGAVLGYRGYHELATVPRDRWETPSGDVVLVLGWGDRFLAQAEPGVGAPAGFGSFVAGLHERPLHTVYRGCQAGVEVRLAPPAAASLLGVPMQALTNRVVELDAGEGWAARLASVHSWPQRFALLDELLAARIRPSPVVARVWAAMRRAGGAVRVDALVAEAGRSHRHLVELFRREVGLTPKRAARVLRFERASRRLRKGRATPAAVAAECGYTDQAHLTREFRRFAGTTPAAAVRSDFDKTGPAPRS